MKSDPLFWALSVLTGSCDAPYQSNPTAFFAFFDDTFAKDSSASARIDTRLLGQVSDLAALWELRNTIRMQRPPTRSMNLEEALAIHSGGGWEWWRTVRSYEGADNDLFKTAQALPTRLKTLPPKIQLKPESLQIFRRMLPAEDDIYHESSNMVCWRNFVAAMGEAGFASHHNTGSAVTFSNEKGRIVFHKPHPVAKVDPIMLLTFGKHINKWFGLGRKSFEAA
jgi:hypothetical protein